MAAKGFQDFARKLREAALGYPGAVEEFPWGERVVKVAKKIFVFLGHDDGEGAWGISCKLPHSGGMATSLPFAEPTGYNLGKSGWVTARFESPRDVPLALLLEWLEESYRAVAPAKLVAELDARDARGAATPAPAPARAKASGRRAPAARPRSRR